jgi:hypothetical protein
MPYLEDLDIDDANDEFWKMDEVGYFSTMALLLYVCFNIPFGRL